MNVKIKGNSGDAAVAVLTPEQFMEQVRLLRHQVPDLQDLGVRETQSMLNVARLDPRFIGAAIHTAGVSGQLESAVGKTAVTMHQENDETDRWMRAEDELRALLGDVIAANRVRRHNRGLTALQTYQMSRQLARSPEHSYLLPHIAEMKRLIRGPRKRKAADGETDAPATPPKV